MTSKNVVKKFILKKLVRSNIWGAKHTPLDFITKGMPENFRNTPKGKKIIEKAVKELLNHEWVIILPKRTGKSSSDHISLNPRKVSEIKQFLAD